MDQFVRVQKIQQFRFLFEVNNLILTKLSSFSQNASTWDENWEFENVIYGEIVICIIFLQYIIGCLVGNLKLHISKFSLHNHTMFHFLFFQLTFFLHYDYKICTALSIQVFIL